MRKSRWSAAITPPARMERRWFRNPGAPHYLRKKKKSREQHGSHLIHNDDGAVDRGGSRRRDHAEDSLIPDDRVPLDDREISVPNPHIASIVARIASQYVRVRR
jgi:hypothetical protein